MGLFRILDLAVDATIDWEMTPEYTFGTFESWGGRERVRSSRERIYYFFIDSWDDSPKLCLMERGIKHARVVAEILAPPQMIRQCVDSQGRTALFERSFAINTELKQWLREAVIDNDDESKIIPLDIDEGQELPECTLPGRNEPAPEMRQVDLPAEQAEMSEDDVSRVITRFSFYDSRLNPGGGFSGHLVDNGDGRTVSDLTTGLMWQREGLDIMSYRRMQKEVEELNRKDHAGFSDWRLPSMAEALSLMQAATNERDQHLHPCFSHRQPFIFVRATRKPGGYWFVDYKHGRSFWASGTIPGGFGRLCRTERQG